MAIQPQFVDDPRIMEPLEEFLRTVRDVVQSSHQQEVRSAKGKVVALFPEGKPQGPSHWR